MGRQKTYTITSLAQQERRARRTSIFVDGSFWRALDTEIVAELGLREGQRLSDEELSKLGHALETKKALGRAFNLLSHRARSTKELSERLARAGFEAAVVAEVIEKLLSLDYLDDHDFTDSWLQNRIQTKLYGRHRIKHELKLKGIADDMIDERLAAHSSDDSEYARAFKSAQGKVGSYAGADAQKSRQRLGRFLMRRGYSSAIAYRVCRDIFAER
ncbi:MAG: RecX family transcriptional regulator [Actinobacteria bacterium]|nr:RecX family transcriptional regulator [Actinomycetota bacterium]